MVEKGPSVSEDKNNDFPDSKPSGSSFQTVESPNEVPQSQNSDKFDSARSTPDQHPDEAGTPPIADEALPEPFLAPKLAESSIGAKIIYWISSALLSFIFLCIVVSFAMVKTVASIFWVLGSWIRFKDPNRFRPFYEEEKKRRKFDTGKLKCDIAYYAKREGLDCEEMKVETEDGFILTIDHITDPSLGSESKSKSFA
jgi:hypothetical protein